MYAAARLLLLPALGSDPAVSLGIQPVRVGAAVRRCLAGGGSRPDDVIASLEEGLPL